ncbi:Ldh family oxidoreductase [Cupriavidus basilensis]
MARDLLAAQGVPADIADDVAEHLVEADRCGYTSHGLSILPNYRRSLAGGNVNPAGRAECVLDRGGLLVFDERRRLRRPARGARPSSRPRSNGCASAATAIVTLRRSRSSRPHGPASARWWREERFVLLSFTNVIQPRAGGSALHGGARRAG